MLIVASQLPIGTRLEKWFCATYAREQKVKRWREGSKVKRCKEGLFEGGASRFQARMHSSLARVQELINTIECP